MTDRTDFELVDDFKKGDAAAFNEIVRRYQERVYWIARRLVETHEDADDVVQDVFVRVYESLTKFRSDSTLFTWLYRITTNVALNALRKKRVKEMVRLHDIKTKISDEADGPSDELQRQEYERLLQEAIERLPPKQKLVFTMRFYDELPYEEMARILKRSEGGLKANYSHAFKKIQAYVRKEMGE